jgi:hypothetical protein
MRGAKHIPSLRRPALNAVTSQTSFYLPCWKEKEEDRNNEVNGKKLGAFEPIAFAVSADQDHNANGQRESSDLRRNGNGDDMC